MSGLRTTIAALVVLVASVATLAAISHGLRAFSSEAALRLSVQAAPRPLPNIPLRAADGRLATLDAFKGQWLLVNFIYTRCPTVCSVQGSEFAQLQRRLAGPIARGQLRLLSVSFDLAHDDPAALAAYKQRFGETGPGWVAARPTDRTGLEAVKKVFGVKVIPDGLGGYEHNAAINVVDPDNRLVAVLDWDDLAAATRYLEARLPL